MPPNATVHPHVRRIYSWKPISTYSVTTQAPISQGCICKSLRRRWDRLGRTKLQLVSTPLPHISSRTPCSQNIPFAKARYRQLRMTMASPRSIANGRAKTFVSFSAGASSSVNISSLSWDATEFFLSFPSCRRAMAGSYVSGRKTVGIREAALNAKVIHNGSLHVCVVCTVNAAVSGANCGITLLSYVSQLAGLVARFRGDKH